MQQAFPSTTTSGSTSQPPPPNNSPSPSPTTTTTTTTSSINSQPPSSNNSVNPTKIGTNFSKLVAENAVVVFGLRGCCMCHVVKRLLLVLGVNPPVVEFDEQEEAAVTDELSEIGGRGGDGGQGLQFPAVFVRGKLFGGLERVMATHISGELVPTLKDAGALWL